VAYEPDGPDYPRQPGDPDFPYGGLGLKIKHHWKKYRPRMYRELEKSGHLEESLSLAEHLTGEAYSELRDQGLDYQQAWESVREEWAFLPSEEDQPGRVFDLEAARRRLPRRGEGA
jgi:hypothetical protein